SDVVPTARTRTTRRRDEPCERQTLRPAAQLTLRRRQIPLPRLLRRSRAQPKAQAGLPVRSPPRSAMALAAERTDRYLVRRPRAPAPPARRQTRRRRAPPATGRE